MNRRIEMKSTVKILFILTFLFYCFLTMNFNHLGINKYAVHDSSGIENVEHSRNIEHHHEDVACKQHNSLLVQASRKSILAFCHEFYNCPALRDKWQPPELS